MSSSAIVGLTSQPIPSHPGKSPSTILVIFSQRNEIFDSGSPISFKYLNKAIVFIASPQNFLIIDSFYDPYLRKNLKIKNLTDRIMENHIL